MSKFFSVSEVARKLGKSESWLRTAEKSGKIPKSRRDYNGWRVYTEDDIESLSNLLKPNKQ